MKNYLSLKNYYFHGQIDMLYLNGENSLDLYFKKYFEMMSLNPNCLNVLT